MLASKGPYGGKLVPADVATQHGCSSARQAAELLLRLLLQDDLSPDARSALLQSVPDGPVAESADGLRMFTSQVVMLPEFHLC